MEATSAAAPTAVEATTEAAAAVKTSAATAAVAAMLGESGRRHADESD